MTNVDPNYVAPKKGERRVIRYRPGMTAEDIFNMMMTGELDYSPGHSRAPTKSRSASRKLSETRKESEPRKAEPRKMSEPRKESAEPRKMSETRKASAESRKMSEPRKDPEPIKDPEPEPVKKPPRRVASRPPSAKAKAKAAAVKKTVTKKDLPIEAIRASLKKAAEKLGEDKIPEYDVKKPERASSVPTAPPVSTKQVEDYLDKTASMQMPVAPKTRRKKKTREVDLSDPVERSRSRGREKGAKKYALREPSPHRHAHLQMIGVA